MASSLLRAIHRGTRIAAAASSRITRRSAQSYRTRTLLQVKGAIENRLELERPVRQQKMTTKSSSSSTSTYGSSWETFWGSVSDDPQDVLWNASHEDAVARDWTHMKEFFSSSTLPLVDVGCGDGSQTTFFRAHVPRTIGVDVSAAAIEIANNNNSKNNIVHGRLTYQVLDLLDAAACQAFKDSTIGAGSNGANKNGDANIYMRGVLMQFSPEDRVTAANNLKLICGYTGCLYLHEYVPQTKAYYGSIFQKQGMPVGFQRVLDSGITPGGIARDEMEVLFGADEYDVLKESDQHVMTTTIALEAGEEETEDVARAPGFFMILKKKQQQQK
jgi:hypothetical protein